MAAKHNPKTPAWPPKSAPRLFVDTFIEPSAPIAITGTQAHYLSRVMRASEGDTVILCDDRSGEWACQITAMSKREIMLEAAERLRPRESVPDFWLCAALLKKDRFDLVLEKATELGAARIQPVITRRCVANKLNLERARTLTIEAAEQCARTALPEICEPLKLDALLAQWPKDRALFFADEEGGAAAQAAFAAAMNASAGMLIGPEGGFDDEERAAIRAHPAARAITLGPRILRGETAAIAATSLWMANAGDWGQPAPLPGR